MTMSVKVIKCNENTYPFNGWDYAELARAWNLPYEIGEWKPFLDPTYFDTYQVIGKFLEVALITSYNKPWIGNGQVRSRVLMKIANDLRVFLKKLSTCKHDFHSPMWEGMSKIESDEVLIQTSILLIGYMWN